MFFVNNMCYNLGIKSIGGNMNTFLVNLANRILSVGTLLADNDSATNWAIDVADILNKLITPALIILAAAGAVYSIILGVKMATAEDQGKRDEARKSLINIIIALVVVLVLIAIFSLFSTLAKDGTLAGWFKKS